MKINSVYLKNFRIHKELTVEFSSGMNLLLGQNGSGKSSILEAIGLTLFVSKYRDGTSNGQEKVIKFGEKEAVAKIEFVGNDEEVYVIEKQFKKGSGYNRLYRKDDKEDMLDIAKEIEEKLKVLVGIDGELGGVYEDIIVSKQNEFINIYKQTPTERAKTFDKIFETDIYRNIFSNFSKETEKKYSDDVKTLATKVEILKSKVENPKELEEGIEIKEKEKEVQFKALNFETKIKKEIEGKLKEIEILEKSIESEKNRISLEKSQEKNSLEKLEKLKKDEEDSKKSQEIVNREKNNFERYVSVSEELSKHKKELKLLELKLLEFIEIEKRIVEVEKEISININEEKVLQNKKADREGSLEKLSIRKKEQELKLSQLEKEKNEFQQELLTLEPKLLEGIELEKELKKKEEVLNRSRLEFESSNNSLEIKRKDREEKGSLEKVEEEIVLLEEKVEEKNRIVSEIGKYKALLKQNSEAESLLKEGQCPYLGESCKNLEEFQEEEYFRKKEREMKEGIESLEKRLEKLSEEIKSLDSLKSNRTEILQLEKDILKLEFETREKEVLKSLAEEKLLNFNLKTNLFSKENGSLEFLKERKIELVQKLENLHFLEAEKELTKILKEIELDEKDIKSFKEKLENLKLEIEKIRLEEENQRKLLEELSQFKPLYEEKKLEIEQKEKEVERLKNSYELYNQNLKSSSQLEEIVENINTLLADIKNREEVLKELEEIVVKLETVLSEKESSNSLKLSKDEVEEKIKHLNMEYGALSKDLESLKERFEKSLKDSKEIEELGSLKLKVEKKLELTQKFRDNIKSMGEEVSSKIIKRISFFATENFRKITGRGEAINWSNEDSYGKVSAYSVVLEGVDSFGEIRKTNFDQLSGGEQVAVAIAIRGAMINLFTKTKFTIFDEPTNNLDQERRKSLADNIGEILQDLEQSIIVTHDDTFKEMAQKVIEL